MSGESSSHSSSLSAVTEYDKDLVRKLIERITVCDDRLVFEFKSGLETEVEDVN